MKAESPKVCWVIIDLCTGLQYWIYSRAGGAHSRGPPHIRGPHETIENSTTTVKTWHTNQLGILVYSGNFS